MVSREEISKLFSWFRSRHLHISSHVTEDSYFNACHRLTAEQMKVACQAMSRAKFVVVPLPDCFWEMAIRRFVPIPPEEHAARMKTLRAAVS